MKTAIIKESQMTKHIDESIRQGLCICFPIDMAVFSKTRA